MSNPLAIATVTATLHEVLTAALPASGVGGALVTALRPDDSANLPAKGVNIFLYQVSPNTAWRNADLPTRRPDGSLLRRPQAALDLHYLFTFYGDDTKFEQQRLLGAVVRQIHAVPALARDVIAKVQTNIAILNTSNLADQIDLVRLTPVNFSLEELSKLWSVFLKTDYVLSVAYLASVVLIETDDPPPPSALPVLQPNLSVFALSPAVIEDVEPQPLEFAAAPPTQITLIGRNLDPTADVMFTTPSSASTLAGTVQPGGTSNQLTVNLPTGMRAGVNLVRLVKLAPAAPHVLAQSNAAPFILQPRLATITPGSPIAVVVAPAVAPRQQVFLMLNQKGVASPLAFTLPADPHGTETTALTFSVPAGLIPAGTYLARIRVDDAESRLQVDAAGTFNAPTVVLP